VCHTPTPLDEASCFGCGLFFSSRVPQAMQQLSDFTALRPLGNGGMSSVYLARRHADERLCVLKTLATVDTIRDPEWRAEAARCLQHEARLLQQLEHPNIARLLDWVSGPQGDYLVLEYVPGLTLEQRLTRLDGQGGTLPGAPLPLHEALAYAGRVAEVLDYLGTLPQPVVHHDIKPANLIVRPNDNELVLVDFGGAVRLSGLGPGLPEPDSYGTPGYAAPEQYSGDASPASDVYGLAATLYHLLTDDDPTAHPLEFPQLERLPPDVAALLRPALARDPQARPTTREFQAALYEAEDRFQGMWYSMYGHR
jgi:serine/threonine protein kinase